MFGWLRKQKKIIIRKWYNKKISLELGNFMFLNYKLSGDWSNYKKIVIKKTFNWIFEIHLNNIVEKGQLTLVLK